MCGHRFDAAAPAGAPASEAEAAGFEKGTSSAATEAGQKRFFDDTTSKTDAEHSEKLKAVADAAMASAPPPAATPSPTPKVEKNVDPVTRQPFEFTKKDLAKALALAAKQEGKPVPDAEPSDVTAYYKAGADAGFARKTLEKALHDAALERMEHKPAAPAGMDAPLTSEFEPIRPSGKKIAAIGGAVALVLVGGIALLSMGGDEAPKEGATPAGDGKPAADGDKPATPAGTDKPRRKAGQLDSKLIGPAIAGVADKARGCHEAARKANPKVAGKMVFDVELEEDGTFSKLDVKQDTVGDARMVECVKNEVKTYAWPKPQGGFFAMEFPLGFDVAEKGAPKGGKKKK